MKAQEKSRKRPRQQVIDTLLDFLIARWKYGTKFTKSDIKKENGGVAPTTEEKILQHLVDKKLLVKEMATFKIGKNGVGIQAEYTVVSQNDDEMIDAIDEYTRQQTRVIIQGKKNINPRLNYRPKQSIKDSLYLFLSQKSLGEVFLVKDLKKAFKVKWTTTELILLKELQKKGIVHIDRVDKDGKVTKSNHFTIISTDEERLKKALDQNKKHEPPKQETIKFERVDPFYPKERMDKADIELLRNRLKEMTVTNENLKLDLNEALETIEKLEVKLESKDYETKKANGLSKSCPSCGFNMERYVLKHGKQVKAILDDCR